MYVHYIWIGGKEIPQEYINNYNRCLELNPGFEFKVWKNEECISLLEQYNEIEYWSKLTFICKYNFLKYLVILVIKEKSFLFEYFFVSLFCRIPIIIFIPELIKGFKPHLS